MNTAKYHQKRCSDVGVGGVLQQHSGGEWQPLSFFSKRLQPPATKYNTFGHELLTVHLSIRHFRHLLEGCPFCEDTDHKLLIYALQSKPDKHSPREIHQLDYISQFTSDLRHILGKENTAADALSRMDINTLETDNSRH